MRELAYIEVDSEPYVDEAQAAADAEWDEEEQLASEGRWEELGLFDGEIPADWAAASIDDLRRADE